MFYAHGGFGPEPASEGQRRFLHDRAGFAALIERCDAMATRPGDRVGYAPHSLRAASAADLSALAKALPGRRVHIHVAEQTREVEDCKAFSGARPVEYLLDHAEVGASWCLIHATHLTADEIAGIARSGAVVGLCPITEANLGDGLFPAPDFLEQGGGIGIGTDSNVAIGVASELRCLEYGQRLFERARNVLAVEQGSTGDQLFARALAGGAQALDAPKPVIAPGAPCDLVALADPFSLGTDGPQTLDRWLFGSDITVGDVWVSGQHLVQGGRHAARDRIRARFAAAVRRVLAD